MKAICKFRNKNIVFLLTSTMILVVISFASCEKSEKPNNHEDYRDKWVGTYEYEDRNSTTYLTVTTKEDSMFNFLERSSSYQFDKEYLVKVNTNGNFYLAPTYNKAFLFLDGFFYTDSICIVFHHISPGGILSNLEYRGKKLKK